MGGARASTARGSTIRCRLPPGFEALEAAGARALRAAGSSAAISRSAWSLRRTAGAESDRASTRRRSSSSSAIAGTAARKARRRAAAHRRPAGAARRPRGRSSPRTTRQAGGARQGAARRLAGRACRSCAPCARPKERSCARIVSAHQLDRIEGLAVAARDSPARSAEAIRARLAEQVAAAARNQRQPSIRDRLHQEAVLLATRADIQEEIDRLFAHVEAARALARQPRNRSDASSISSPRSSIARPIRCAPRRSDRTLTAIGLDLKTVIDQMREQVQNIE